MLGAYNPQRRFDLFVARGSRMSPQIGSFRVSNFVRLFVLSLPKRSSNQSGIAMLEAAIVLPLLIAVVFGIIQYALLFLAYLTTLNASAIAARYGTLGTLPPDPTTRRALVQTVAQNAVRPFLDSTQVNATVDIPAVVSGVAVPDSIRVRLVYNYPLFFRFVVPQVSGNTYTITAETVMR